MLNSAKTISHVALVSLSTAFSVTVLAASPAAAHEAPTGWKYPWACCSNKDCQAALGQRHQRAQRRLRRQPDGRGRRLCRQARQGLAGRRIPLVRASGRHRRRPHHLPVRAAQGLLGATLPDCFSELRPSQRFFANDAATAPAMAPARLATNITNRLSPVVSSRADRTDHHAGQHPIVGVWKPAPTCHFRPALPERASIAEPAERRNWDDCRALQAAAANRTIRRLVGWRASACVFASRSDRRPPVRSRCRLNRLFAAGR